MPKTLSRKAKGHPWGTSRRLPSRSPSPRHRSVASRLSPHTCDACVAFSPCSPPSPPAVPTDSPSRSCFIARLHRTHLFGVSRSGALCVRGESGGALWGGGAPMRGARHGPWCSPRRGTARRWRIRRRSAGQTVASSSPLTFFCAPLSCPWPRRTPVAPPPPSTTRSAGTSTLGCGRHTCR